MIDETGKLQIIDFGVAGILLSNLDVDKRKTVIGTPHWMAPELQSTAMEIAHGTEVDVWAFGITMYECSTGAPPNARVLPGRQLRSQIKQNPAPRLPETFSTGLQDLVECVLEPDPKARPSMEEICEHSYIKNTEAMHPTIILRELVETYYQWETQGGQRASLFFPGGAAQPKLGGGQIDDEEEWNFSTTANFEQIHADLDTALGLNNQTGDSQFNFLSSSPPRDPDDYPGQAMQRGLEPAKRPGSSKGQTDAENEQSIARGARHMQGLFDNTAPQYSYNYGNTHGSSSDLPLRTGDSSSSLHRKELSVSSQSGGAPQINLDSITSKKGKRGTMAWKWEDNLGENDGTFPQEPPAQPPVRPVLKHAATMPAEPFNARPVSEGLLDLDAMMDEPIYATLPTNTPYASTTDPSATLDANPPPEDDEGEMGYTMRPSVPTVPSNLPTARRAHQPVSSISSFLSVEDATDGTLHPPLPSTHHWGPPSTTTSTRASVNFPPPIPPAALANDAPFEVMHDAFTQVMTGWLGMLEMNLQALGVSDDEETDSEDEYGVETETGNGNGVAEEENGVGNDWSEAGFAAGSGASREVSSEEEGDEE